MEREEEQEEGEKKNEEKEEKQQELEITSAPEIFIRIERGGDSRGRRGSYSVISVNRRRSDT